jgi:hypothetical protein
VFKITLTIYWGDLVGSSEDADDRMAAVVKRQAARDAVAVLTTGYGGVWRLCRALDFFQFS